MTTYPIRIRPLSDEDGGGWLAEVPDLPGCMSDGETPEEALLNVQDAIQEWIAAAAEMGREVPSPRPNGDDAEYSGRLSLRMPKSLHAELVRSANREGVSVNQYVLYLLSAAQSGANRGGVLPRDLGHAVARDR